MELTHNYQFNYQKLLKFLSRTRTDGYVFAMADDVRFISQINSSLIADLFLKSITASIVFLRSNTDEPMMQQIRNASTGSQALIIANLYDIVNNTKEGLAHLLYLNFSREELRSLNLPVLFWADAASLSTIANHAPDLFSQRRFTTIHFTGKVEHPVGEVFDKANWQEFAGTEKFKEIEAKITTFERRLHDAEDTGYNKNRIANEIALPLSKEYAELGITADKAENLLNKYEPYFDNKDSRQLQQLAEVYYSLHNYQQAIETLQRANTVIESKGNIYPVEWFNNINVLSDWMVEYGTLNAALEILEKAEHILSDRKDSYNGFNVKYMLILVRGRMGDINMSSGNIENAKTYYEQCLETAKWLAEAYPDNGDYKRETSIYYDRVAGIYLQLGNLRQAIDYFEQSLDLRMQLEKNNPNSEQLKRDVSVSYKKLGDIFKQLGDLQQAKEYYENALNIAAQLEKSNPYNEQLKRNVSVFSNNLGDILQQLGDLEKAKEYYENTLNISKKLNENNIHNKQFKRDVSVAYNNLGDILQQMGDLQKAQEYYQESLNISKQLEKDNPHSEQLKRDISVFYNKLGDILQRLGNLEQAKEYYEGSLNIAKQIEKSNPQIEQLKRDVSVSYNKVGDILQQLGNWQQAKEYYESALNIATQLEEKNPYSEQIKRDKGISYIRLGLIEESQQHIENALFYYNHALVIFKSLSEKNPLSQQLKNDIAWTESKIAALNNDILQSSVQANTT